MLSVLVGATAIQVAAYSIYRLIPEILKLSYPNPGSQPRRSSQGRRMPRSSGGQGVDRSIVDYGVPRQTHDKFC